MMKDFNCLLCDYKIAVNKGTVRFIKEHLFNHGIVDIIGYLRKDYFPSIKEDINCEICGKETKFINFVKGFKSTCSTTCTNVLRYGYTSHFSKKEIKDKIKETNLERYGCEFITQVLEVKEKIKASCLKKYGVSCHLTSLSTKKKIEKTNLERYGLPHPAKSPIIRDKIEATCLSRYGETTNLKTQETKDKIKKTNLERYGFSHPMQSEYNKNFSERTRRENYYDILVSSLEQRNIECLFSKENYIYSINDKELKFRCPICTNIFYLDVDYNYAQRVRCPRCSRNFRSSVELEIIEFLENVVGKVVKNTKPLYFFNEKFPKEIDILVPSHKLGIELDGLYWHSDKEPSYHIKKTEAAEQLGIQLLHITDSEWINKREIVKSIILSKLGIYKEKVLSEFCMIKEVPNKEYKEFLENNHLQGHISAPIKLGLYHNNQLVQLCSFSKNRFKKDEIELIRHCSLINYQVLGGLSKLIKHYMRKYHDKEKSLITYVDRRYGNGSGYESVGFKILEKSGPNYWYFSKNSYYLQDKNCFQKHKLHKILENFDPSLTEMENMRNHGYSIYYDCGNYKLEYRKVKYVSHS